LACHSNEAVVRESHGMATADIVETVEDREKIIIKHVLLDYFAESRIVDFNK
jgi:hypothetical protein